MKAGLKINKVIKYLILSDLSLVTGWGLLAPVFAIFVINNIEGGNAFVVGMAAAVFWIVKSVARIPISVLLDSLPGERDDYAFLIFGLLLASLAAFGFLFAKTPLFLYFLQGMYGLAASALYAGWTAIFTRHIDKGRESTNWGVEATAVGLGIGLAGALGGWAVTRFGFAPIFISVGILSFASIFILLIIRREIKAMPDGNKHFSLRDIYGN